jgi:transposase
MDRHQTNTAEQAARRSAGKWPSCAQWHHLGPRSDAPWRDLPANYGPYTICYNRFVRWRQAGIWDEIMEALAAAHDGAVQMIDASVVRVHQHGACIAGNRETTHGPVARRAAVVDANGLPVQLGLTPGEAHDTGSARSYWRDCSRNQCCGQIADMTHWIRALVNQQGAWANIAPKRNRKEPMWFSPYLYRARNLVERFFNKIKQCRRIATRYDKLAANYLAFIKLAAIRI